VVQQEWGQVRQGEVREVCGESVVVWCVVCGAGGRELPSRRPASELHTYLHTLAPHSATGRYL